MTLTIKKQLSPTRPMVNGYGYGNKKKFLTIHQTGNTNKGANAQMHANLQSGVYGASWHWQVDDKEAIQSFDHTYRCWHASDGRGDGNSNSIGIEGCINSDGNYIQSVKNMAELAAKILKDEGIPIENMRQHHDFDTKNRKNCPAQIRAGKDGINWNKFVQMVKDNMKGTVVTKPVATPVAPKPVAKSIDQLANEVIAGKHGSGDARKKALGSQFDAVQTKVNQLLGTKAVVKTPTKTVQQLVTETLAGKHGNGDARKKSLGSNYNAVMNIINGKTVAKKSVDTVAREVIAGKFGNGAERKKNIEKAGYNYNEVQKRVNQLL